MNSRFAFAAGFAFAALGFAAVACTVVSDDEPAEPVQVVESPAPEETPVDAPAQEVTWDEGTLECGRDAGVAVDVDKDGNNWAYCEPGMVG